MREITYTQAIQEALAEEMERDEKVFLVGEAVQAGVFGATTGLVKKFGKDRVMDCPLDENTVAAVGFGAAIAGYRPVADFMFSDFMPIAFNEITNNAAKWHFIHGGRLNVPVVFVGAIGAAGGAGAEHSQSPEGYYMHTPGLKVVVPSTPYDAKGLMKSAIRDDNPVCYFLNAMLLGLMGDVPEGEYTVPIGVADVKRKGSDVTVVATSRMVQYALEIAAKMEGEISVEVVDPRTLLPLDIDTIVKSVKKTGRVVIVDEDVKMCGPTAEIAAQIMEEAFDSLKAPIKRVAAANTPIPGGRRLTAYVIPQPEWIAAAIRAVAA